MPPVLCATAASSPCWPTDLRSPTGPCDALPATRMAYSPARFAINSPRLWMLAFIATSLTLFLINCPHPPSPSTEAAVAALASTAGKTQQPSSVTWWHFTRLVISPCGSKWQRYFRITVGSELVLKWSFQECVRASPLPELSFLLALVNQWRPLSGSRVKSFSGWEWFCKLMQWGGNEKGRFLMSWIPLA